MASKRTASLSKCLRTRACKLMLEDLSQRSEFEFVQQAPKLALGGFEVDVVCHPRLPVERHARMSRIKLPRVEIEYQRPAFVFERPQVGARHLVGIDPEVGAAGGRNV